MRVNKPAGFPISIDAFLFNAALAFDEGCFDPGKQLRIRCVGWKCSVQWVSLFMERDYVSATRILCQILNYAGPVLRYPHRARNCARWGCPSFGHPLVIYLITSSESEIFRRDVTLGWYRKMRYPREVTISGFHFFKAANCDLESALLRMKTYRHFLLLGLLWGFQ